LLEEVLRKLGGVSLEEIVSVPAERYPFGGEWDHMWEVSIPRHPAGTVYRREWAEADLVVASRCRRKIRLSSFRSWLGKSLDRD
jgi:hypothetical protein